MSDLNGQNGHFVRPPKQRSIIPIVNPETGKSLIVTDPETSKSELPTRISYAQAAKKSSAQAPSGAKKSRSKSHSQSGNGSSRPGSRPESRAEVPETTKTPTSGPALVNPAPGFVQPASAPAPRIQYPPTDDDLLKKKLDVYAKSFIPGKYKRVNDQPGQVFITAPLKFMYYSQYAREVFPACFLPGLPKVKTIDSYGPESGRERPAKLDPSNYQDFFLYYFAQEIRNQRHDTQAQWLYWHEADVEFVTDQFGQRGAIVTIVVPGLLENSPVVEEDDEVHLRQLRQGYNGAPGPVFSVHGTNIVVAHWTGFIYHARVKAILRVKETLILRVTGLTSETSEIATCHNGRLRLNVQFLASQGRVAPQEMALSIVQASLQQAMKATYSSGPLGSSSLYWFQSMLFPTEADCDMQANLNSGILSTNFNDQSLNFEQRVAVENICGQNYGVIPYLISGPPGTGKTKTMIEIALQLVNNVHNVAHILVCAPSDQAADTLADRLRSTCKPSEVLRLCRPTRSFAEVSGTLLPYCCVHEDRFVLPPFEMLMTYKIVVTTCRDASILVDARMTNTDLHSVERALSRRIHPTAPESPHRQVRLHWDALLIDEAAQATETESLIPLCVVAPPINAHKLIFTPQVIMAGDEYQLNPRTSRASTPLRLSLFARLFKRDVYAKHPLAREFRRSALQNRDQLLPPHDNIKPPTVVTPSMSLPILRPPFTNLIRNYRSHPAILAVPSSLWYYDTLEAEAPKFMVDRLLKWDGWRGRRWPIMFHNYESLDDVELEGGGWFNPGEADLACYYAKRLLSVGSLREEDICIMSPFNAQVRRIRLVMRGQNMWGVNIGPTEAFQGLEHSVVILCTTRSRRRFVAEDQERGWGLIGQPNALNVALTRAKCGLIILGMRQLLVEDEHWKAVIDFCERNGLVADANMENSGWIHDIQVDYRTRTRLEIALVQKDMKKGR